MKTNKIKIIIVLATILIHFPLISKAQNINNTNKIELPFDEYLNRVGKNNISFLAEKYNVSIAEAEVIAQKVLPDPEIEIEAKSEDFTLGLGYTLELGNKRGARVRLAKSQAELEKFALEYYYQELRADATDKFLDAIEQRELLRVKQSSYEYMLELSKSDSIRFKIGEITQLDARQSKLEAATLLNDVYEQEAVYKSALITLQQYMGKISGEDNNPIGKWDNLDRDYNISDLIFTGLNNRVDLFAAHKNVEVAINQQKLVKSERKMDLGIGVKYEKDWHNMLPTSNSVTGTLSVPLKFSNTNKGALKVAQYGIDQTRLQQESTELQVQSEIYQAFYFFEAAKKKVKQYKTGLLEDSNKVLQGMVYRYKRGESDITDVLIAQRTYNDVQQEYLETMKGYVSALVNLQKTCGIWDIEF